jgi:hypothetical protein
MGQKLCFWLVVDFLLARLPDSMSFVAAVEEPINGLGDRAIEHEVESKFETPPRHRPQILSSMPRLSVSWKTSLTWTESLMRLSIRMY